MRLKFDVVVHTESQAEAIVRYLHGTSLTVRDATLCKECPLPDSNVDMYLMCATYDGARAFFEARVGAVWVRTMDDDEGSVGVKLSLDDTIKLRDWLTDHINKEGIK